MMRTRKEFLFSPLLLAVLFFPASVFAQDSPTLTLDEECMALAHAPDGRIAYAVRRILTTRRLEIERDDIWLVSISTVSRVPPGDQRSD